MYHLSPDTRGFKYMYSLFQSNGLQIFIFHRTRLWHYGHGFNFTVHIKANLYRIEHKNKCNKIKSYTSILTSFCYQFKIRN